ncbi:MAG: branched-chain amino acid ABC transporter permease [Sulfolobales archaeon]|nr:branched-chain amino acid ABC transporter permease [Sulfolobales archaeon]MDW8083449.1 branched-chain amino acid ABC transporter permease [Sulfolobales archaeon]
MEELKYITIFGFFHSLTYLVFSLGFSLVFGVARLPNLSYGALYVFTGYVTYTLLSQMGLDVILAIAASILLTAAISLLIGEFAIKPAIKFPVSVFITTMAVAYIFEEYFRIQMGLRPVTLPLYPGTTVLIDVPVSNHWFLVGIISSIMILALLLFLFKTNTGRAVRAVAENWEESMRLGINPLRVLRTTFIISGVYAALTGILLTPLKALTPSGGWTPLFTAFAVVVMGGIGNVLGTVAASFIYGFTEQLIIYTLGGGIARVVPLILIVLVLIIRPHGLFGRGE